MCLPAAASAFQRTATHLPRKTVSTTTCKVYVQKATHGPRRLGHARSCTSSTTNARPASTLTIAGALKDERLTVLLTIRVSLVHDIDIDVSLSFWTAPWVAGVATYGMAVMLLRGLLILIGKDWRQSWMTTATRCRIQRQGHVYLEPLATSSDYPSSTSFFDPLGFSKTDVSLYFNQPSMTGVEAWSTTLSTIEGWSKDRIESLIFEEQAHITSASVDDSHGSTSSKNITPISSTSRTPTKATKPSDGMLIAVVHPPIAIQPVYPTSTTKPLPPASLVTKTSASSITRIGYGGMFGILSLVAVVIML